MMEPPQIPSKLESYNKQPEKAYIAGLIDGNSSITAHVVTSEDHRLGFDVKCRVRMTRYLPFAIQRADDLCVKIGVLSNIRVERPRGDAQSDRYIFEIVQNYHIKNFLDEIYPFLRDRREEADVLSNQIVPSLERGEHLHEESFIEIVRDIDSLHEMNPHSTRTKYDAEYFEEEFGL